MSAAVELFRAGGWVMWPIAAASLAAAFLACERVRYFWRATRFHAGQATARWRGRAGRPASEGAADRILRYTFAGPAASRRARFQEAAAAELDALDERLGLLAALVAAAPLLGLLGTVAGMMDTFDAIRVLGAGSPSELSRGISKALLTTQAGLVAALPGLCAHRWLVRRKRTFEHELARVERELAPAFQEDET